MIAVLDTNVIVSGILRPFSRPGDILRLVSRGTLKVAYDIRILSEYREVLSRPRFGFSRESIETFLLQLEEDGLGVSAQPLPFRLTDPGDEPFLEVALAAPAGALVTGNKRHFPKESYEGVAILSPGQFCDMLVQPKP